MKTDDYSCNKVSVTDFSNNIYVIHNLLDDVFCNNMINHINNAALHKKDYNPTNNVQTYSTLLSLIITDNDSLLNRDISLFLTGYVRAISCIINRVNNLIFNSGIPKISEVELRKVYGATRQHIDGISIQDTRLLTSICALNDDYDDGIISFPVQNIKIKLNKGDILLFPPYWTHPHFVSTPRNNFRYTITFWYLHPSNTSGLCIS